MVRSFIISPTKADRFYWLGRYEMRVYLTLHQLNKCYDKMIDGEPDDYIYFWQKLDVVGHYKTNAEFTLGMLYDEENPSSVILAQRFAMDNAMMVREDIMSETLSYLEMSVALMKKKKAEGVTNTTELQSIIDWSLAFWGSAEQRIQNHKALNIIMLGRNVENIDMKIRFGYSFERIALAFESLLRYTDVLADIVDEKSIEELKSLVVADKFNLDDSEYKSRILYLINHLVLV